MDFPLIRGFYGSNKKSGELEDIPPRFDNASEVDIKFLKGHLMGVKKARENYVKMKIETKLKFKKGRSIRPFTGLGI